MPPVVVPGADQPWQQVVELCRLDLQPSLVGASVLGEDVEDQLGPVDHARLELALQVALLARAQVLVADQEVVGFRLPQLPQLVHLALSDEEGGIDLGPALDVGRHDLTAGRPGQVRQL